MAQHPMTFKRHRRYKDKKNRNYKSKPILSPGMFNGIQKRRRGKNEYVVKGNIKVGEVQTEVRQVLIEINPACKVRKYG